MRWITSNMYSKDKPCMSNHDEDVKTFQFQQATIFTAKLLFQSQLITTIIYNRGGTVHRCHGSTYLGSGVTVRYDFGIAEKKRNLLCSGSFHLF